MDISAVCDGAGNTSTLRCAALFRFAPVLALVVSLQGCGGNDMTPSATTAPAAAATSPAAAQPMNLSLDAPDLVIEQGASAQYTLTAAQPGATWSVAGGSSIMGTSGLLLANSPGVAIITATIGSVSAQARVQITAASAVPASFSVSVEPQAGEDLASACSYDLLIANSAQPVAGVWVIFERADSLGLWQDADMRALATDLHVALLYAHQCNAASYADIQSDGRRGPARALVSALNQLGTLSGHTELATANLALYGFSAAGVLSLTTAGAIPARVLTVVTYDAGSAPLELRQLTPSADLETVPVMMLANGNDNMAGTYMTQQYFAAGRAAAAPWAFAVQPGLTHCCTLTSKSILLAWMRSVLPMRASMLAEPLTVAAQAGSSGHFQCALDGIIDANGYGDCAFTGISVSAATPGTDPSAAWIPDAAFGAAWSAWVQGGA